MNASSRLAHPAASAPDVSTANDAAVRPARLTRPAATAVIHHKPAKKMRHRVPPVQRIRVMQRYASGENQTAIARQEGINRETVGRIVKCPEMDAYVEEKRELWRGLCDPAIEVIRQKLKEDDKEVALRVLESNGVIPPPGATFNHNIQTTPKPTGDERIKELMEAFAAVAIERARVFKTPFPELQEVADKIGVNLDFELASSREEEEDNEV